MSRQKKTESLAEIIARRRERLIVREGYISLFFRTAILALAGYFLFTQVFLITQNSGLGMFPALKDGDLMVVFRMQEEYRQDDVITYRAENKRHVGRIVASGGDVVDMDEDGKLFINEVQHTGEILYPSYARETGIEYPFNVPEGSYFVMGDYRTQTLDSRDFGSIHRNDVEGKVITILRRRSL